MPHHHDWLEQPGHRPHAQQRLEDDHRQGQRTDPCQIQVRPAQRGEQQDRLADDRQHRCGDMFAMHVQRDRGSDERRCQQDGGDAEAAPARGQQRQDQHQHAQGGGDVAVHLLAPGLVRLERTDRAGGVVHDFMRALRPGGAAIAGRPVRAAQARVGQANEGAEDDHAQRQADGEPGDAMEMAIQHGPGDGIHLGRTLKSVSAASRRPCTGRRRRSRADSAGSRNHGDR